MNDFDNEYHDLEPGDLLFCKFYDWSDIYFVLGPVAEGATGSHMTIHSFNDEIAIKTTWNFEKNYWLKHE